MPHVMLYAVRWNYSHQLRCLVSNRITSIFIVSRRSANVLELYVITHVLRIIFAYQFWFFLRLLDAEGSPLYPTGGYSFVIWGRLHGDVTVARTVYEFQPYFFLGSS